MSSLARIMTMSATPRRPAANGSDAPGLEVQVQPGHLIRRAQQIAVSLFLDETRDFGVTPIQFAVLLTLGNVPGQDQASLAARVGIDTATLAAVSDRLESRGYLSREPCPEDRRRKRLTLTAEGRRIAEAMQAPVLFAQKRILAPLNAAERREFLRLLGKLVDGNNESSRAPLKAD